MRALSARQAATCEKAIRPRCRCRCQGELHGALRAGGPAAPGSEADEELVEYLRRLPETDPHYLKTPDRKAAAG